MNNQIHRSNPSYKEIIKKEYVKCAGDPVYFMKKYCVIQHPIKGKIPFALYDFQEKTIEDFIQHRFNIINSFFIFSLQNLSKIYQSLLFFFS